MAGLQASLGRGQWGLSDQPEPHRGLDPGVVGLFAFLPVLTLSYSESRCKLEAEGTAPGGYRSHLRLPRFDLCKAKHLRGEQSHFTVR